jgi:hypothetical protein
MAIKFVDLVNGNDANNGTTFALRKKTLSSAATGSLAGDVIRVMGRTVGASGINATFTNLSGTVTLASALTVGLYTTGAAWTVPANVTATGLQAGKLGATSASNLAIAALFTTGKIAHFPLPAVKNLNTFQQLSFWIKSDVAVAAGVLRMDTCSDTTGNTVVDSITLPALAAGVWQAITLDKAAFMGATINAIRLHAISDPGTVTLTIDDVVACKAASAANSLSLNSLISSDGSVFYAVKSIDSAGTSVRLDTGGAASAQSAVGIWSGTTGSLPLSILNPINTAVADTFNVSGAAGNPITISGGWDSVAMTTQSGYSVLDSQRSGTTALTLTADFITLDRIGVARATTAINLNGATKKGYSFSNMFISNCAALWTMPSRAMTFNIVNITNSIGGLSIPASANYSADAAGYSLGFVKLIGNTSGDGITVPPNIGTPAPIIQNCSVMGNTVAGANGFNIQSPCVFYNNTSNDNPAGTTSSGFFFQNANGMVAYNLQARNNSEAQVKIGNASIEIFGLDTNFNLGTQVKFVSGQEGQASIYSWTPNATATKFNLGNPATGQTGGNVISSQKEGGTAGNNNIFSDYGTVTTNGVVAQPGSGIAWQLSPNANALAGSPLRLNVGKVACPANATTTITYYAKLSAAGPTARLKVFGGRHAGVGSAGTDITVSIAGTTYAQYAISVTPTEACVLDIWAEVFGSTTQSLTVSGPIVVSQ